MTTRLRLAVLHDSPDFGGHEKAFLTWLPAVLAHPKLERLDVWASERNEALAASLAPFFGERLRLVRHPFVKKSAEPLRAFLRRGYGRAAKAFVASGPYDAVVLLQGRIENLATPMTWLDPHTPLISYVPMAHSAREMGRGGLAASVTDALKRRLYRRPDRWIVPAEAVKAQLSRAGARAPVHVVENVPPPRIKGARGAAPISRGRTPTALFMGRFDAGQKGLDRLVEAMPEQAATLGKWRFVFVGTGPYTPVLQGLGQATGLDVTVEGWTQDPRAKLAEADVLLMPSRFEGVPLVLLEALEAGTPVLASDLDVFREYLPADALYDFSRREGLAKALDAITTPQAREQFRNHASVVSSRLNIEGSQAAFAAALLDDLDLLKQGRSAR